MGSIVDIFNVVLYYPLLNGLIFLYNTIAFGDLGLAIIILTVLIRLALYPLSQKALKSQGSLNVLSPKLKEIQKKYQDNKEEQARQMLALYKEHKINPASGCFPILIQLPILIALYRVFAAGLNPGQLNGLYGFIQKPESLNVMFLGIIDLSRSNVFLSLIAGALQFIQIKMMTLPKASRADSKSQKPDMASIMNQQMTYFAPIMTIIIGLRLPAGLPLYWTVITLFGIIQQHFAFRSAGLKI